MRHKILICILMIILSVEIAMSQCGTTFTSYPGLGTSTLNYVPVYSNANGCLTGSSLIYDNGTNVGIGTAIPSFKLDVGGSMNIPSSSGYNIGGVTFLTNNGIPSNLNVGYFAGTASGWNNTYVGSYAGATSTGWSNTYLGYCSAQSAAGGADYNNTAAGCSTLFQTQAYGGSAFGYWAGKSNTTGCSICAFGEHTLENNTTGDRNFAFGWRAMHYNVGLEENVAIGGQALYNQSYTGTNESKNVAVGNYSLWTNNPSSNSNGINNTAIGFKSGYNNLTGYDLTLLGYMADVHSSTTGLNNSTAIGANAIVRHDNSMILGNNNVNVGIGLSGNATGPQNKLEIDEGNADQSGLRFRQLTDVSTRAGRSMLLRLCTDIHIATAFPQFL